MNLENFYQYCFSKKGSTEHFPFDENTLVFKIGGKIFALSSLSEWEKDRPTVNLKCNPDYAQELRAEYESVQPAYHMNKKHWNTIHINRELNDLQVNKMIDESYNLVFKSLSKKTQTDINKSEH